MVSSSLKPLFVVSFSISFRRLKPQKKSKTLTFCCLNWYKRFESESFTRFITIRSYDKGIWILFSFRFCQEVDELFDLLKEAQDKRNSKALSVEVTATNVTNLKKKVEKLLQNLDNKHERLIGKF